MLTRRDLDSFGCDTPDCGHDHSVLYLIARCHPRAGVDARYVKQTGSLVFECRDCKRLVAEIAVA